MTKARFEELQYLCFIDSAEQARSNANYDKLFKIYAILSIIVDNLSLDEAMIAFKGWLSFHQYMPRKPAKYEKFGWPLIPKTAMSVAMLFASAKKVIKLIYIALATM